MIFLSHNSKDKPIVEPLAIRLRDTFGQDNIFMIHGQFNQVMGLLTR